MRIVQLIDSLGWGGAQKLLVTFTEAARIREAIPTVIGLRLGSGNGSMVPAALRALGARVDILSFRRLAEPGQIVELVRLLRRERFDILHTHLAHANILGAFVGRVAGIPVVSTLHNIMDRQQRVHPINYTLETQALFHGARRVIAVGHTVAETHRERLRGKTIVVIPNAVAPVPPLPSEERSALRKALVGDPARLLVIAVGRLTAQKGYGNMLAAFAEVCHAHPSAALVIVGGGRLHAELAAQITALNLEGYVKLLGARTDVPRLLAASDVFFNSSHWEGLPVALLEAMSAGLPVIATQVGDVPYVVAPGTGRLVPSHRPLLLADALRALLSDPEEREAMGAAAQAHVLQHYSATAWVDKLLALYAATAQSPN